MMVKVSAVLKKSSEVGEVRGHGKIVFVVLGWCESSRMVVFWTDPLWKNRVETAREMAKQCDTNRVY